MNDHAQRAFEEWDKSVSDDEYEDGKRGFLAGYRAGMLRAAKIVRVPHDTPNGQRHYKSTEEVAEAIEREAGK